MIPVVFFFFPASQMSGMFESWMQKLVSAVMQRETEANVVVVDWISFAQQLYHDAVNHTNTVGQDIAAMLNWLQVCTRSFIHPPIDHQFRLAPIAHQLHLLGVVESE